MEIDILPRKKGNIARVAMRVEGGLPSESVGM